MTEEALTAVLHIKTDVADVKKATEQLKGIATDATVKQGFDNLSNVMKDATSSSANGFSQLQKTLQIVAERLAEVVKHVSELNDSVGKSALRKEVEDLKKQYDDLKKKVSESTKAKESEGKVVDLLAQKQQQLNVELHNMIYNGQQDTEAFKKLKKELVDVTKAISDLDEETKSSNNDDGLTAGIIQGLGGVAAAASVAQGAMALFGEENEELQKILVKVNAVMAISQGLQTIQQTLNKDSIFQMKVMNGLREWWNSSMEKGNAAKTKETISTVAETIAEKANTSAKKENSIATNQGTADSLKNATAQEAETIAKTEGAAANKALAFSFKGLGIAIKSIPVWGWIIAGVSALVAVMKSFADAEEEALDKERERVKLKEDSFKTFAKETLQMDEYIRKIDDFNGSAKQEKQLIEELNQKYGDSIGKYSTLAQWKDKLIEKGQKYIEKLAQEAEAQALLDKAIEAYNKKRQVEELSADAQEGADGFWTKMALFFFTEGFDWEAAEKKVKKKNESIKEQNIKAANDAYKAASEAWLQAQKKLDDLLKNAKLDGDDNTLTYIQRLQRERNEAQEKLQAINPLKTSQEEIDRRKTAVKILDDEIKKFNSIVAIETTLQRLQRERNEAQEELEKLAEISASDEEIKAQKEKIKNLDDQKRAFEDRISILSEYEELTRDISREEEKLHKMRLDASDEEIKAQQELIRLLHIEKNERDRIENENSFDGRLKAYEDYSKEVLKIEQDRQKKIEAIEKSNLSDEEKKKKKEQVNTYANLSIEQLMPEGFDDETAERISSAVAEQVKNVVGWTAEELNDKIIGLKNSIKKLKESGVSVAHAEELAKLETELDATTKQFEELRDKETDTSDKALKDGKKWEKFSAYFSGASDILKGVVNDLDSLSDEAKQTINDMLEIADAGMQMIEGIGKLTETTIDSEKATAETSAQSISTVEKASIILAVISAAMQIAMKIINMFKAKKEKEAQAKIEAIQNQVDRLQKSYDELGAKIDKAYSTDATKMIAQQDVMLKKQQALLKQEIEAEKAKKKTDKDRIKQLESQIEDIDKVLSNRDEDIVTKIIGKDYASVLDDFSGSVMSAMDDAETSVEDAVKNISKSIKKAAIQQQLNAKLQPIAKDYAQALSDAMTDGVIDTTEEDVLKGFEKSIETISENYLGQFDDLWEKAEQERQGVSGGVNNMTQDTAEEMNGRLTQMQAHTYSINENVKMLADFAGSQLEILQGINSNTLAISEGVRKTNSMLEDFSIRGLKMR